MKTLTYDLIKSWEPCYDPIQYIPKDWTGNALDILKLQDVSIDDKFWCVFRDEVISDKTLRLFAVWCYRQTLLFIKYPDPRSINAANVAEAYALGNVTYEELKVARSAARSAAYSTAWSAYSTACSAAWSAAWSTAYSAARSTAYSAACSAAWSAHSSAWSAARSTAYSAARSAAYSTAWSTAWSAYSTACSAAWSTHSSAYSSATTAQLTKLIEMLEEESK